jgi:hypothetical protein
MATIKELLKAKNPPLKVGDKVRVKQGKSGVGETLWEITRVLPDLHAACFIREAGTNYAEQRFDTSLLIKA